VQSYAANGCVLKLWVASFSHPRLLRVCQCLESHSWRDYRGWLLTPNLILWGAPPNAPVMGASPPCTPNFPPRLLRVHLGQRPKDADPNRHGQPREETRLNWDTIAEVKEVKMLKRYAGQIAYWSLAVLGRVRALGRHLVTHKPQPAHFSISRTAFLSTTLIAP